MFLFEKNARLVRELTVAIPVSHSYRLANLPGIFLEEGDIVI
jgi:hypothetical protein